MTLSWSVPYNTSVLVIDQFMMKKNFIRYVVLLCCVIATVFTACTTDDDNQTAKPTDAKALVGTWECDLSGRTFALWNYGKAWNVWTFNADRRRQTGY